MKSEIQKQNLKRARKNLSQSTQSLTSTRIYTPYSDEEKAPIPESYGPSSSSASYAIKSSGDDDYSASGINPTYYDDDEHIQPPPPLLRYSTPQGDHYVDQQPIRGGMLRQSYINNSPSHVPPPTESAL